MGESTDKNGATPKVPEEKKRADAPKERERRRGFDWDEAPSGSFRIPRS